MIERVLSVVSVVCLTAGVACWQMFLPFPEEADTYFVMNIGRHVLEHGVPYVDPFTVHENLKLVAQQWLSGVIFWELFKNFGVDGLRIFDAIIGAVTVLIHWRLCLFVSGGNKALSFAVSFIVALLITPSTVPRPQLMSTLLLLIEVFALEKFTRTNDAKFLVTLPFVSVALVNFHAAMWLMSIVVCLPFMFVRNARHIKFLAAAMAGVAVFGLINPYGLDAMTYVFRSYGVDIINANIPEMFPTSAYNTSGKIFFALAAFIIFTFAKIKVPWRYVFLSGGITFMALMHMRSLVLFDVLATVPLAFAWRNFSVPKFGAGLPTILFAVLTFVNVALLTTLLDDGLNKVPAPLEVLMFAAAGVMLYTLLIVRLEGRILHPQILPRKILPLFVSATIFSGIFLATFDSDRDASDKTFTDAIKFILRTDAPENVRLYVNQGGGGLAGSFGVKYYIDSRSEVFIPANNGRKDILTEYVDFTDGRIRYDDFFARYDFTHIILTSDEPFLFDALSRDKNFRVIYESERVDGYNVRRCKVFVPKEFHP
ncbi:MAG: hypothetical protein SR1Q7_05980 [Quinella sp. 1Q7]|nr:hypothetical protein [Quinella sp. 1Q7]